MSSPGHGRDSDRPRDRLEPSSIDPRAIDSAFQEIARRRSSAEESRRELLQQTSSTVCLSPQGKSSRELVGTRRSRLLLIIQNDEQ